MYKNTFQTVTMNTYKPVNLHSNISNTKGQKEKLYIYVRQLLTYDTWVIMQPLNNMITKNQKPFTNNHQKLTLKN